MTQSNQNKDTENYKNSGLSNYAKYSGLAFQMGAIIGVAVWGGIKLDELAGTNNRVFTIILSLLGVFAALYLILKDFIKK